MYMINITITVKRKPHPQKFTLKELVEACKTLNKIYGDGSQELAVAIGRLFDNHCRR